MQLHLIIRKLRPDVVFIQGLHNPFQLLQLHLFSNARVIVQHHAEKPFSGIKKKLQRLAGKYVDAYLFSSHEMGMDWVKKGNIVSAEKIHEVMELSSVFSLSDKHCARLKTEVTGTPVFLWVGRLNENKDPLTVVKTFVKFADEKPSAKLYMIYQTEELLHEVKNIIRETNMQASVILIGKVEHKELLHWYNSADFIVSGSYYEGSGTAICEGMSCGCIPVVTNIFSFRTMTGNGSCGFLFSPGNENELLSVMRKAYQTDMIIMRKKVLDFFHENLSFDAIATRISQVALSV
ncbi:MAG: glycosyltransferase family 4 protein [Bacteroidetes bacterium]|nr:glycosyltransferase family 4 protein [Bacteroidota bacterium]